MEAAIPINFKRSATLPLGRELLVALPNVIGGGSRQNDPCIGRAEELAESGWNFIAVQAPEEIKLRVYINPQRPIIEIDRKGYGGCPSSQSWPRGPRFAPPS